MKINSLFVKALITTTACLFFGWGNVGHRIINYNTFLSVTPALPFWEAWSDSLAAHGSDADYRKSSDPNEAPKHYIDIDNYPEFNTNGFITRDFDSLVSQHGYSFVLDQGILPWAIIATFDSVKAAFKNNQMHKAMLLSADLGHYIGDMHMPLHITRNYNGQYSGQTGVHSRYESTLINNYNSQILYSGDSLIHIVDIPGYVFNTLYENYIYVDSVLKCDSIAKAFAGNTTSSVYYSKFWELSKGFTTKLFKEASFKLDCLIYTAWIDAQSQTFVENGTKQGSILNFTLFQNYPNPFNPVTSIQYSINSGQFISLKIYDILGNEVSELVNEYRNAGSYQVKFDGTNLSSGVYFYKLQTDNNIEIKKMTLLK